MLIKFSFLNIVPRTMRLKFQVSYKYENQICSFVIIVGHLGFKTLPVCTPVHLSLYFFGLSRNFPASHLHSLIDAPVWDNEPTWNQVTGHSQWCILLLVTDALQKEMLDSLATPAMSSPI